MRERQVAVKAGLLAVVSTVVLVAGLSAPGFAGAGGPLPTASSRSCTVEGVHIYKRHRQGCLNAQWTLRNYYSALGRGVRNRYRWGDWECRGTRVRGTCKVVWGYRKPVSWKNSNSYFSWRPG